MGVKCLWKLFKPEDFEPENLRIAIDISIWIHSLSKLPQKQIIFLFYKRILKLLFSKNHIIFIFDSKSPKQKVDTVLKRKMMRKRNELIKNLEVCKECNFVFYKCKHGKISENKNIKIEEEQIKEEGWGELKNGGSNEYFIDICGFEKHKKVENISEEDNLEIFGKEQILDLIERGKRRKKIIKTQKNVIKSDHTKTFYINENKNIEEYEIFNVKDKSEKVLQDEIESLFCSDDSLSEEIKVRKETKLTKKTILGAEEIGKIFNHENSSESSDNIIFKDGEIKRKIVSDTSETKLTNKLYSETSSSTESTIYEEKEKDEENIELEQNEYFKTYQPKEINESDFLDPILSISDIFKKILTSLELPFIDAPFEADSQCGYMYSKNMVDLIISDDNDIFLFGAEKILRKDKIYKIESINEKYQKIFDDNNEEGSRNITRMDLIKFSILLGSDYNIGIKGYGLKTCLKKANSYEFDNNDLEKQKQIYINPIVKEENELYNDITIRNLFSKNHKINIQRGISNAKIFLDGKWLREIISCFELLEKRNNN